MTIQEIISTERTWACENLQAPDPVLFMLDRIEAKVTERIEELEAQVPRVVRPTMKRHCSGPYYLCICDTVLDDIARFNFCPGCGAKLDWEAI